MGGPPVGAEPAGTELELFAEVMRTLGDATRLRILRRLGSGTLRVAELTAELGISQPLVSHHLKALKAVGLVSCRRDGQSVYYRVRWETFANLGLAALWEPGGVLGTEDGSADR